MTKLVKIRKNQGERPWLATSRWKDHRGEEQFHVTCWKSWQDAMDYSKLSLQWIPS